MQQAAYEFTPLCIGIVPAPSCWGPGAETGFHHGASCLLIMAYWALPLSPMSRVRIWPEWVTALVDVGPQPVPDPAHS